MIPFGPCIYISVFSIKIWERNSDNRLTGQNLVSRLSLQVTVFSTIWKSYVWIIGMKRVNIFMMSYNSLDSRNRFKNSKSFRIIFVNWIIYRF